jgi:hypothetical protein
MSHINLPEGLPGISAGFTFSPRDFAAVEEVAHSESTPCTTNRLVREQALRHTILVSTTRWTQVAGRVLLRAVFGYFRSMAAITAIRSNGAWTH